MINDRAVPLIAPLWPLFRQAGARWRVDARLLLSLAYIQSGLEAGTRSPSGAVGLMQMMPSTAGDVAAKLGRKSWVLTDPVTAIEFGAAYLAPLIERFGLPRLGLAAYVAGPGAVQAAGGQVPPDQDVQRTVRNVMAVWQWLNANFDRVLDASTASSTPSTTAGSATTTLPVAETSTASSAPSTTSISAPPWRLISPPDDWKNPIAIDDAMASVLEQMATRLHLVFSRDEAQRKVYVGAARAAVKSSTGRLVMPIASATVANDGAYPADTGLDILVPVGTPVTAAGSGRIVYSEAGHTPWNQPPDTANSVLIALDTPFVYKGRSYGFTWYTHLSRLRFDVSDGSDAGPHVAQGDLLGWTGIGNRVPHLHFGVVQDRAQTVFVPPLELAAYFGWAR